MIQLKPLSRLLKCAKTDLNNMVVISIKIDRFNHFLRFDQAGDGHAEGLRDNATRMPEDEALACMQYLQSDWPLSIEDMDQEKVNNKQKCLYRARAANK